MIGIYRVNGNSMLPEMNSGDYVICLKSQIGMRVGANVVVDHRIYGTIVKRIKKKDPRGYLWLSGNNPSSVQGSQIGWVSYEQVLGRVLFTVHS